MKTFTATVPHSLHRDTHDQNKTDFDLFGFGLQKSAISPEKKRIDVFYWLQSNQYAGQEFWAVIQGK